MSYHNVIRNSARFENLLLSVVITEQIDIVTHAVKEQCNPYLEYNIIFPSIEKTGRKPCSIREHIIGIVMVSKRDFDNVTCVWSCNVYAL